MLRGGEGILCDIYITSNKKLANVNILIIKKL